MDSRRLARLRSLAIDTSQGSSSTPKQRPSLGERHLSAPLVARISQNTTFDASQNAENSSYSINTEPRRGSVPLVTGSSNELQNAQHRHPSVHPSDSLSKSCASSIEESHVIRMAIVGKSEVDKSTFIKHALELRKLKSTTTATSRVLLRGVVHRISMTELDLDDVEVEDSNQIVWPEYVGGIPFGTPDSVICLYDAMSKDSVTGFPQFLTALSNLKVSVLLVPFKALDTDPASCVTAPFVDQVRRRLPHVSIVQSQESATQTAKTSMLVALKEILATTNQETIAKPWASPNRNGANRPDTGMSRNDGPQLLHTDNEESSVHTVSSENVRYGDDSDSDPSEYVSARSEAMSASQSNRQTKVQKQHQEPRTPISETGVHAIHDHHVLSGHSKTPHTPESYSNSLMQRPGTSGTSDSRIHHTFFHGEEDDSPSSSSDHDQEVVPCSPKSRQGSVTTNAEQGVPFKALVHRLLQLPATKHESKFVPAFLCLYRAFATPIQLLSEIIDRFVEVEKSNDVQFNQTAEMLRYLQVLANWTANYPGDFSTPLVREAAISFLQDIEQNRMLSAAAKEINNNFQVVVNDEDLDWAYQANSSNTEAGRDLGSLSPSDLSASMLSASSILDSDEDEESTRFSRQNSGTASMTSSIVQVASLSSQSATNLVVLEQARAQARRLRPSTQIGLSKLQWHFFMDTPAEDLARELTRIDWIRYSAIRPRDFVRDVSLPAGQATTKGISAMVQHFNHISYLIAGMILLREKPKHRAKTAEKAMELAWKVRQLNNYNCVNAIVAGMQNIAVTRLAQTMELVPTETQRQFMRLNVLVDATKSYATYRIAWENTSSERIPLIPSLQKDLRMAMIANPTFIGNNISWKKFEIMGDAIISIQKSQETPYNFPEKTQRANDIMKLFLETKFIEDPEDPVDPSKELYERSKQLEPNAPNHDTKKRFDWLRR